jgi:hypothetical protein
LDEKPETALMPAAAIHVGGSPSYSIEQFNAALAAAREAKSGLITGNLDDRSVQRSKGISYNKFSDLAEIATFVDDTGDTPAAIEQLRRDSQSVFRDALAEARIRGEVARIVPVWIGSPSRKHGGVFFAGQIGRRSERGPVSECQVAIGSGEPLTILVPPNLIDRLAGSGRTTIIIGSLIDRPSERIAGYDGLARQAVWVSSLIPVDE